VSGPFFFQNVISSLASESRRARIERRRSASALSELLTPDALFVTY
jgi:hypothetical protein